MAGAAVFLFFIGLFMICLEIFIPGGITGLAGAAAVITSFWMAYARVGPEFGVIFITAGIILVITGVIGSMVYFPKTRFSDRVFLKADQKGFASDGEELKHLEGAEGVAASRLRPSGAARFGGKRYSVVADDYVEAGEKVKVAEIRGNRIIVRKINGEKGEAQ